MSPRSTPPPWAGVPSGSRSAPVSGCPADTSLILVKTDRVGPEEPLTREKLCPVLAVLRAHSERQGFDLAADMVGFHGQGHSAVIHTEDRALAEAYGKRMKTVRIIVNSPSSQGAIGGIYNGLLPSLTLGCGSWGSTSVSNNVSAAQLLNVKRVGTRRNNLQWFKVPPKIYFEPQAIRYLASVPDVHRVTVVTDATMTRLGFVDRVTRVLQRRHEPVTVQVIDNVEPEPSIDSVQRGARLMRDCRPDTIIALGGGSPMDAAKVMWLLYEQPDGQARQGAPGAEAASLRLVSTTLRHLRTSAVGPTHERTRFAVRIRSVAQARRSRGPGLPEPYVRQARTLSQGWSVLAVGPASVVTEPDSVRRLTEHAHTTPWPGGEREMWVSIRPAHLTGRRITAADG
ncbi:iron-containing alcohol dehydrogenase [Streptomyces sp. NPDC057456]|uniref:iron-containing alcohol dehydrogenase n=1 Tax=Streptomyces sp. NPDC057456 TaxID=3346139 RepID=UPI003695514C